MRREGYAPLRDYAAIGDGRTIALTRDGSPDWLCLPDLDPPIAFSAVLDADKGGGFAIAPEAPITAEHRYLPDTNMLETTIAADAGTTRVTDAMPLPILRLAPVRDLPRRVDGISRRVPMRWRVEPRFEHGQRRPRRPHGLRGPAAHAARRVQHGAQVVDAVEVARDRDPPRLGAGGQQQPVIAQRPAVVERDPQRAGSIAVAVVSVNSSISCYA